MPGNYSLLYTATEGATITHTDRNAEHQNHINNHTMAIIDDYSTNATQMQSTADPYPGGVVSLASSGAGELERLRYRHKQEHVTSQWYIFPDLVAKTANYTATQDDRVILCDATSGAITITLPAASGLADKMFYIKKTDSSANAVTIDGNASETIDGATTKTLAAQYDSALIVCNGSNWFILAVDTKTEAGKTFTAPTIADFTNAAHDHGDADDGGAIVWQGLPSGSVVQVVKTQTGAVATGSTVMPIDDTIPQNTEGDEYMTLAITPKATTNILVIEIVALFGGNSGAARISGAIFQDATANALAAQTFMPNSNGNQAGVFKMTHTMAAGTTSETTFKFRAGPSSAYTVTFNGEGGGRLFGGVAASSITIWEYKAS